MANDLGKIIEQLRGEMSQAELARRIGLSRERVGQLERGRKSWPDVEIFNALARALNVPVTRLLRSAGANVPGDTITDDLEWLLESLDDDGRQLLVGLGTALLPLHRRRPETGAK